MFCEIWHRLCNLKNLKNNHGQAKSLRLYKSNTPWMFCTFFKLHKWYKLTQFITYIRKYHIFDEKI